jgi:hypothetical protein
MVIDRLCSLAQASELWKEAYVSAITEEAIHDMYYFID